jgi:hypothetical protein
MSVIAEVGCCISLLYAPGIDPALSAWEVDSHASADQYVAGQPLCPVVPEYPLSTGRTPRSGTPRARSRLTTLGGLTLGSLAFAARQPARSVQNVGAGGQTLNQHAASTTTPPGHDRWEIQCKRRSSPSLWP